MNKASGDGEIPTELFKILKDGAVKVLHWICQQIGKISSSHRTGKSQFKKGNPKECSSYYTIALISHASRVVLKILQSRFQQNMKWEFPDIQARFRKGRGTRGQIVYICWIIEKGREVQKNIYFCFIDYAKAFDYVDHKKL